MADLRDRSGHRDLSKLIYKKYGDHPEVVLVHGGPGAAGEMTPVAEELSTQTDILEPWQTAQTIEGQIEELAKTMQQEARGPVVLVGFSWGAWLACFTAAQYPDLVRQLVLISSGPFEAVYAEVIQKKRWERMDAGDREKIRRWTRELQNMANDHRDDIFLNIGLLFEKVDAFHPLAEAKSELVFDANIYRQVWPQAAEWRRKGKLLAVRDKIQCPIVALHGEHDPHPAQGVFEPFAQHASFRFVVLPQCGHKPWIEKFARQHFYEILRDVIAET